MSEPQIRRGSWMVTLPLAGIAICFMVFLWLPGHRALKEKRRQIELKQQFVNQAADMSDALTAVEKQIQAAQTTVTDWEKSAPQKKDLPSLYGKINALAKDAGLAVSRFDPESPIKHQQVHEIPITIACEGRFRQVHEFLRGLEQMPQTIWVESLRIDKQRETGGNVQCSLNLVVFANNPDISNYTRQAK
jgi:Tfp pilus assembly protein PilO